MLSKEQWLKIVERAKKKVGKRFPLLATRGILLLRALYGSLKSCRAKLI